MPAELDRTSVERAYARWAPVYDLVFDRIMATGRRAAVSAAERAGTRILDVGVGTGLELPYFQPGAQVTGVDLSEVMLRKAAERVRRERLVHVTGLSVMDAEQLAFADGVFDAVVAPYVLTVVPNPPAALDELARVTRSGGEVILVNHFSAETGARASVERWLAKRSSKLGWRPEFPWAVIADWCGERSEMRLEERRELPPLGLFTLVRIRKSG